MLPAANLSRRQPPGGQLVEMRSDSLAAADRNDERKEGPPKFCGVKGQEYGKPDLSNLIPFVTFDRATEKKGFAAMVVETVSFTVTSSAQKAALTAAFAFVSEVEAAALTAPPGRVLDACETLALGQGRKFLADTLQSVLQQRIDDSQKKMVPPASAPAAKPVNPKGRAPSR